jgi:hypothetical protein
MFCVKEMHKGVVALIRFLSFLMTVGPNCLVI